MYIRYTKKSHTMTFSPELVKGTLKTIILKLLADHSRMYGYEMTQKVKDLTKDKIHITEGALYPSLHALEQEGLVTVETEFIGKRIRKYYSLSQAGHARSEEKIREMAGFLNMMHLLLDIQPKTRSCIP